MAAIRSKNTKAELLLMDYFNLLGVPYSLHEKDMPGHPDIVLPDFKVVVFCDGDFWHGRAWAKRKAIGFHVREDYWIKKIEGNIKRDIQYTNQLKRIGWKVLRLWENDIKKNPDMVLRKIFRTLSL